MILSKLSLQTVFDRRSLLSESESLKYVSNASGVNLAIHSLLGKTSPCMFEDVEKEQRYAQVVTVLAPVTCFDVAYV